MSVMQTRKIHLIKTPHCITRILSRIHFSSLAIAIITISTTDGIVIVGVIGLWSFNCFFLKIAIELINRLHKFQNFQCYIKYVFAYVCGKSFCL